MKVLTRQVIEAIAKQAEDKEQLIALLEEQGFVRPAPELQMTKKQVVEILKLSSRVRTATVSPYLLKRLVAMGYLVREKDMEHTFLGRKPYIYHVGKKGENLLRLAANWGKRKAEAEAEAAE